MSNPAPAAKAMLKGGIRLDSIREVLGYVTFTTLFPVATLCFLVLFFMYYFRSTRPLSGTSEWIHIEVAKTRLTFFTRRYPMEKGDAAPLILIMVFFTFLALFQLGDFEAPQSFFKFTDEQDNVVIELEEPAIIDSLMFYTGLWTGTYKLEFSSDGISWLEQAAADSEDPEAKQAIAMDQAHSNLFKWRYADLNYDNPEIKFIRLTPSLTPIELGELALFAPAAQWGEKTLIPRANIRPLTAGSEKLFDEQELVPERPTYMNGMYFDEIYHGRTALEFLRGERAYETTHPPLGKALIAASVYVFGMTPFGWRFTGAVFGVIMLLVMYIFLKNLFGKTSVAVCGTLLLGFDFMRFVQTRIATIDTYGVFFILLAYFFMYRHITTPPDARFRKSLAPLALSGFAFGLGCASKWIVVYAGIGLAVIYLIRLILLAQHYWANDRPGFSGYLAKTLVFSVLFFVIIPVAIYYLSYIPFAIGKGLALHDGMLWDDYLKLVVDYNNIVIDNQILMYDYHSLLEATHPYSSWWWEWIIDARPILYVNTYNGDLRSSFAAFGNPVIWWGGLIAMFVMVYRIIRHSDGKALFILIGYLSQLVPWMPITRIVFIYHYFPSTLFLVLALAHVFDTIMQRKRGKYRFAVYSFTAASGALFAMFYPALTGIFINRSYFEDFLRWIPVMWPL